MWSIYWVWKSDWDLWPLPFYSVGLQSLNIKYLLHFLLFIFCLFFFLDFDFFKVIDWTSGWNASLHNKLSHNSQSYAILDKEFSYLLHNLMDTRWWSNEAIEMYVCMYKLSMGLEKLKFDKIMLILLDT